MIIPFDGGTFSRHSDDWLDYEESPLIALLDGMCVSYVYASLIGVPECLENV